MLLPCQGRWRRPRRNSRLWKLLGYAIVRGLHAPLPLGAPFFCYLTTGEFLAADAHGALSLLTAYDPRRALLLRAALARRHGRGGDVRGETLGAALEGTAADDAAAR